MTRIRIPSLALAGFDVLSKLDDSQIKVISEYLETMPVGTKMQEVDSYLSSILNPTDSQRVVKTLRSFSELLQPSDVDLKQLASDLATSYKDQSSDEVTDDQIVRLENNLYSIFGHSTNLKLTLKAFDLFTDDNYLVTDTKIITDIRLVFNDDIVDENRNAVLIHHLYIDYFKSNKYEKMVLTLNLSELTKLKQSVERAINKEEIIKKDYEDCFHFLNISDDE